MRVPNRLQELEAAAFHVLDLQVELESAGKKLHDDEFGGAKEYPLLACVASRTWSSHQS